MKSPEKRMVVSGSLAYDLFFRYRGSIRDHFRGTDEEILRSLNFRAAGPEHRTGGCGGNVALNLALMGIPVLLDSWIGGDGDCYLRSLSGAGVDVRAVHRSGDCATPTGILVSDRNGEQIIVFGEPANQPVWDLPSPEASDSPAAGGVAVVTALPPERFERIIPFLSSRGFTVLADPGKVILDLPPLRLRKALETAGALVMNRHEYGLLREHLGNLWKALEERNPDLIITDGAKGAVITQPIERGTIRVPAYPLPDPADPYGAGDAFLAGVAAGRFHSLPLEVSARIGATASSYALEKRGSQSHRFEPDDFARRFASLRPGGPGEETARRIPAEEAGYSDFSHFFTDLARISRNRAGVSRTAAGRATPDQGDPL